MASTSFVIAVSSAAGGGKTTLVTGAAELLGATTLATAEGSSLEDAKHLLVLAWRRENETEVGR